MGKGIASCNRQTSNFAYDWEDFMEIQRMLLMVYGSKEAMSWSKVFE
jgi:hypothetical protein